MDGKYDPGQNVHFCQQIAASSDMWTLDLAQVGKKVIIEALKPDGMTNEHYHL